MADTYTVKNKKQGFFSKLGNSFASIPLGIIIVIFGCIVLWNNEKKNVINIKDVKEMRENVNNVSSAEIDKTKEGKLIATKGNLDFGNEVLVDSTFGISVIKPILVRNVEIYQWTETSKTEDDKTTYTYNKEWTSKPVDSANFAEKTGHENKSTTLKYVKEEKVAKTLKVGAYTLSESFKDHLTASNELLELEPGVALPEGYTVSGKYITNSVDVNNPAVDDVRIWYTYGNYEYVSVLGKQSGSTIEGYETAKGSTISKLVEGDKSGTQMIDAIESGNKMWKWMTRLFGVILVCMGMSMILSPLTTLIGAIPFLGKIVNGAIGVVSASVGFAISLIVIGVAWLVYRPILGIALIVVSVGLIVLAKMYVSKKNDGKTPEVTQTVTEEKEEENKEEN